jgi:adenine-specific DNA-methyltransferase
MSRLTDLIANAKAKDPELGTDLEREFRALSSRLAFGLNFERHRPEAVELPQRSVRRGDKVRVLPPRGSTAKGDQRLWQVKAIHKAKMAADLELIDKIHGETQSVALDDLVVVAEFRDTIYPGLVSTGKVSRGGDKPWHTVINGENYHALKALTWTHRGKVDAIYIDPPYNTGAKDWKYNNDYVEGEDLYRHSKWLAMMERRLLLAKELLNPLDSVLIVTIDEKEYLRLGLLLEQVFPEGEIQMATSVINRAGSQRAGRFSRVDEYIFYVLLGTSRISPWTSTMLDDTAVAGAGVPKMPTVWFTAVRRGTPSALRAARPKLFYPVYLDAESGRFVGVGSPIAKDVDRRAVPVPNGAIAMWPVHSDGTEQTWRFAADRMRDKFAAGTARLGKRDPTTGERPLTYLQPGTLKNIQKGIFVVTGRSDEGALELAMADGAAKSLAPRSVWNQTSHFARDHGSTLLKTLLGAKRFDFPKSLFAVEDSLRFIVADKPDATVVDFFAGSGTTAHAVMRLNKQDGGKRQCISVTNNEVGADEQTTLREKGLRPGDPEWELRGICDYVTKPRVQAAITGKTPEGKPIKGDYKFTDEFPMADGFEENAEFFTLTYETPLAVTYQTAFARIAPLLWMRAGSAGRRIEKLPAAGWDVADAYGLLVELDKVTDFLKATRQAMALRLAYIVTDDERRFQALARRLPEGVEAVRLYESYLTNFAFANGDDT